MDVKDKSVREGTTKRRVCHGEIHSSMKLTSVEIMSIFSWRLEEVNDVGWVMVSWTIGPRN